MRSEPRGGRTDDAVIVAPRDASTVCVLRDGPGGLEVFLMRRPTTMAFAAGMYVFPGGSVDEADDAVPVVGSTDLAELGRRLSSARPRALLGAAVRETYEECGALVGLAPPPTTDDPADRAALVQGRGELASLLDRHGLAIDPRQLPAFAHWVTPEREGRRFDTRFFLAALRAGQVAHADGAEADGSGWWRPDDAIEGYERRELGLMPPTTCVLAWLASCGDVAEAMGRGSALPVRALQPLVGPEAGPTGWALTDAYSGERLDPTAVPVAAEGFARGAFERLAPR